VTKGLSFPVAKKNSCGSGKEDRMEVEVRKIKTVIITKLPEPRRL
jgi:hypothetical protein